MADRKKTADNPHHRGGCLVFVHRRHDRAAVPAELRAGL